MHEDFIRVDSVTLEEAVIGVTPQLPYTTTIADVQALPDSTFPWHWHSEVEFFWQRKGAVEYHLPDGVHVVNPGEVAFLNANILHMTRVHDDRPCHQDLHQFLPSFIAGPEHGVINLKYINPVVHSSAITFIVFPADSPEARSMIADMQRAATCFHERPEGWELLLRNAVSSLWLTLFSSTRHLHDAYSPGNPDDSRIKKMLSFISDHYAEKLTIGDIAAAGQVGERECFRIFRRCLGATPLECLLRRRLSHACDMLRSTEVPILDIALGCGFCSASYFGKLFHEQFGMSPRDYRAQCK